MTRLHPARPWAPIPIAIVVLFVWWTVAHNSGSGWVQFLGDAVFGIVLVGIVGPPFAVQRSQVRVLSAPADGTSAMPLPVHLRASTRLRVRPIDPPGPPTFIGPTRKQAGNETEVTLIPRNRGVHDHLVVEVASAAPFGLQWWSRTLSLPLAASLHVAPRRGQPIPLPQLDHDQSGIHRRPLLAPIGEPRGVRFYQTGDQRRRVHWPSTAHLGRLMVKEMEEPSARPLTLKISLPADVEAAERLAERSLGTVIAILDRGAQLVLTTDENEGRVSSPVPGRIEAGRRLARAVSAGGIAQIELVD
jgi:uncharacterized protein (DUF58 family)